MMKFVVVVSLVLTGSAAWAEHFRVFEGTIYLEGDFEGLAGIEAISPGGYLSFETVDGGPLGTIPNVAPFPITAGIVISETANHLAYGVLGQTQRIDIQGSTATGMLYGASADIAATDLTVNLGIGGEVPVSAYCLTVHHTLGPSLEFNGHHYQLVEFGKNITWHDAEAAASCIEPSGIRANVDYVAHLATITSAEEQASIESILPPDTGPRLRVWLGGRQFNTDREPADGWGWITGEPWGYTNWDQSEPNNFPDGEDYLAVKVGSHPVETWGTWNDEQLDSPFAPAVMALYEFAPVPEPSSKVNIWLLPAVLLGLRERARRLSKRKAM